MGLFDIFTSKNRVPSRPEAGIARATLPGHFEAWVGWNTKSPAEVFRVTVTAESPDYTGKVPVTTYTFAPAHDHPFSQPLEASYELKEFLVGAKRAKTGTVTFDFLVSTGSIKIICRIEDLIRRYRGKGEEPPALCVRHPKSQPVDSPEIAALPPSELKAYSEKVRAELEAKRRREEEEAKKREEERKAAEAKAAAEAAKKAEAKKGAGGPAAAPAGPVDKSKPTLPGGKCLLVYGSSTGNTAEVGNMIKAELGDSCDVVKNITDISPLDFGLYQCLILGVPTWHIGEMQDDWAAVLPDIEKAPLELKGKKVAIFGLGDGKGYPETYVDAMQELWEKYQAKGAQLVGLWPTEGYDFSKSKAIKDGKFLGLVIDVENQNELSERRVKEWCNQLRNELFA